MTRLRWGAFDLERITAPDEIVLITEEVIRRALTATEREILKGLFETTDCAYQMFQAAPRAVAVRKQLSRIARTGELPDPYAAGRDQSRRLSLRVAAKLASDPIITTEQVCENWTEEFVAEAGTIQWHQDPEAEKALEMLSAALQSRGTSVTSASKDTIRSEATRLSDSVRKRTRRGRETKWHEVTILWGWADFGETLSLRPSAAWNELKRARHSRFLTWIDRVADFMPERTRTPFRRGLAERLRVVRRIRSNIDARHNFKASDFSPFCGD